MLILYSVTVCRYQAPSATVRETTAKRENGPGGDVGGLVGGCDVDMGGAPGGGQGRPVLLVAVGGAVMGVTTRPVIRSVAVAHASQCLVLVHHLASSSGPGPRMLPVVRSR
jgi:hypothetical protein